MPDTPQSIAWKLSTLPLMARSTPDCRMVSAAVSYSEVEAPAIRNSTRDKGIDRESAKQNRKQPKPNYADDHKPALMGYDSY